MIKRKKEILIVIVVAILLLLAIYADIKYSSPPIQKSFSQDVRCHTQITEIVPCKIYIEFEFDQVYKNSYESTKSSLTQILNKEGMSSFEIFVNPQNRLVEAIINTNYNEENTIGKNLTRKYPKLIKQYKQLKLTSQNMIF